MGVSSVELLWGDRGKCRSLQISIWNSSFKNPNSGGWWLRSLIANTALQFMPSTLGPEGGGREGGMESRREEALENGLGWNKKGSFDSDRLGTEISPFWEQICSTMQSMGRTLPNWRESWIWFSQPGCSTYGAVCFWKRSMSAAFTGVGVRRAARQCCLLSPDGAAASSSDGSVGAVSLWKAPSCVLRNNWVPKPQPVESCLAVSCRYSYCQIKAAKNTRAHMWKV